MKISAYLLWAAVFALPFLGACEWSHSEDHPTVILTVDDNGRAVGLPLNANLELILKGNPTTGDHWQTVAINPAVLQYQNMEYNPDDSSQGSGGTYLFHYQAVALGSLLLQLNYYDPTGVTSLQSFAVTVTVNAP